jgi:undecaprenol kinase
MKKPGQSLSRSLTTAMSGIRQVFQTERNFRIQNAVMVLVVLIGLLMDWSFVKWCFATIAIAMVLGTEMVNTAIEYTWDHLEPNHHPVVGTIKDIMAGAVLVVSIGAAIVGILLVFSHSF